MTMSGATESVVEVQELYHKPIKSVGYAPAWKQITLLLFSPIVIFLLLVPRGHEPWWAGILFYSLIIPAVILFMKVAPKRALRPRPLVLRRTMLRRRAHLGADGIALEDAFVPYGSIESVDYEEDIAFLEVKGRKDIYLRISNDDRDRADAFFARRERRASVGAPQDAQSLARADVEDDAQWRSRVMSMGEGGYCAAPIDRSKLVDVARDATAEPTARIAACELLGRVSDDERRALLAAREVTAHPRVRVALDAFDAEDRETSDVDASPLKTYSGWSRP